jgi:hypothetical protein
LQDLPINGNIAEAELHVVHHVSIAGWIDENVRVMGRARGTINMAATHGNDYVTNSGFT